MFFGNPIYQLKNETHPIKNKAAMMLILDFSNAH